MIENIPIDFFISFNDILFLDESHEYVKKSNQFVSVTTLIHAYCNKFDEDYWSEYKANELGKTKEEILNDWKLINKKGTLKGSMIHMYAESLFQNKIFKTPIFDVENEFNGDDSIVKEYNITKVHVDNFYGDVKNKLIPIKQEWVVYDEESSIAGMVDLIFYNVKMNEFQLWDYKTNKKLTRSNNYQKLLNPLSYLDECDLNIYSLQLSLYKYIIEKNTNIKLGSSYLVWLSHNNPSYEVIKTIDLKNEVELIVNEKKKCHKIILQHF